MEPQCLSSDDTWQSILEKELRETSAITPRTLSILKDNHEYCDPNVLMNLRHDKRVNPTFQTGRESISSSIMEAARRHLKTEYIEKTVGAMHKKMIDNEVQKFKQHLARLKRINATSNRPLSRKPLRVRFQRMTIRSRSGGSSAGKHSNNPAGDREIRCLDSPPTGQFQWADTSPSAASSQSNKSLPAVYGNSVYDDVERGPNTTPVSFLSGILAGRSQAPSCLLEEPFPIGDEAVLEVDSQPSSPPPCAAILAEEEEEEEVISVGGDFVSQQPAHFKEEEPPETVNKSESEKRRKVKNTAYKQFMKYVCNKSARAPQVQIAQVLTQVGQQETESKREEKIAMVLGYLQRKKNSPDSSVSETPPEPVTTAKIVALSHDPKTARASSGPYEHRYQAQRDLIKKQKMQLEEQQKKIQELTLARLQEEAKHSQSQFHQAIDELEDGCTLSIRPQLKTLRGQPDVASAGKIVERMEQRAKERDEKKQMAAERRKLAEEERKKRAQEEEDRRKREEEDKKREAFERIREESIRQREMRERNRKEQERMLELHRRAESHNKRRLCRKGLRAFKLLLLQRDDLIQRAHHYYANTVLKTTFLAWKRLVQEAIARRIEEADGIYSRILLRNSFHRWKGVLTDAVQRRQVAEDMYEMRLQERAFRKWSQYINEQHVKMAQELETANEYYTWVLLRKAFKRLRAYPKVAHLEREKEHRKMILRQKVQDMLPDFRPVSPSPRF